MEAVDQQERANGGPRRPSGETLRRAVERLLERADALEFFEQIMDGSESEPTSNPGAHSRPEQASAEH